MSGLRPDAGSTARRPEFVDARSTIWIDCSNRLRTVVMAASVQREGDEAAARRDDLERALAA